MKVGILGLGYWGPNLVRNFSANHSISDIYAFDISEERMQNIKKRFPNVSLVGSNEEMLNQKLDILAIATPVDLHHKFAKEALLKGTNIWVEKPFTSNSEQALELIEIAEKNNLKIFVDHTFIYTGAVRKMKELIDNDGLGDILYFDSVRINLGLFQHDVNVIWDLAPHDFSIMTYLLPNYKIVGVSANGIANYYDHENIAHVAVYFENNCFAHFHVNWTSPVKIRRMIVGGTKKMLVFNDMENFEKIKIYDSSVEMQNSENIHDMLVQYRTGDLYSPKVIQTEALAVGVNELISAIKENRKPLTDGYAGLQVVQILEAAEKSVKNKGEYVEIKNLVTA